MAGEKGRREFVKTVSHALLVHLRSKRPEISGGKPIKPIRTF
jgi:hypothetical protein